MYEIMKKLVSCGYDGLISADHVFAPHAKNGNRTIAFAYPTGYLKGLYAAAKQEVGQKIAR